MKVKSGDFPFKSDIGTSAESGLHRQIKNLARWKEGILKVKSGDFPFKSDIGAGRRVGIASPN